jgi:hypothetical protein
MAQVFINHCADINRVTQRGESPLLRAIRMDYHPQDQDQAIQDHTNIWADVNVNQCNSNNQTPLGQAIRARRWIWVHWLLDRDAQPDDQIKHQWYLSRSTPIDVYDRIQAIKLQQEQIITAELLHRHHFHLGIPRIVIDYII